MKKIIALSLALIFLLTFPISALAKTRVYLENDNAVVVPDSALDGWAVTAAYNDGGVMLNSDFTRLGVSPYDAQSITAKSLGCRDKVFFLDENYRPSERRYISPWQGEENIPVGLFNVNIGSYPVGADVYVDGVRYEGAATPCEIPLTYGWHHILLYAEGFKPFDYYTVIQGGTPEIDIDLAPDISYGNKTLVVNSGEAVSEEEVDYADESLTFREAVNIANSDGENAYTIIFDESVESVASGSVNNINITADNLVIDGISGREIPVKFTYSDKENKHPIILLPTKNVTLYGIELLDGAFSVRPDDNVTETESYENIRIINCTFSDYGLFAFGGACKAAGTSASVNYNNLYFCGNRLYNTDCFFAYSGDCDNSVADGIYVCHNVLRDNSAIDINCADCNTWYIYGRETGQGGLTSPETSDGNTVRNVLVSGNRGGRLRMSCAVGGNSNNTIENVVVRNNEFTDFCEFTCAQNNNEKNSGVTMKTCGNTMRKIEFAYNTEEYTDGRPASLASRFYVMRSENGALDGTSQLYCDNNKIEKLLIHGNVVKGVTNTSPADTIDGEIEYKNLDESEEESEAPFKIGLENEIPEGVSYVSKTNNTLSSLTFFMNSSTTPYRKTQFMNKESRDSFTLAYSYNEAVENKLYTVMAVKGTRDNYKIDGDSLLYINEYYAENEKLDISAVIPYSPYKGAYVVLLTSNDGKITEPRVLVAYDHIHDFKLKETVDSTCARIGTITYECEFCGEKTSEIIPKKAHTVVQDKAVKPSFDRAGKTAGSHCKVCGEIIVKQKTVAKLTPDKTAFKKVKAGKKSVSLKWTKKTKNTTGYIIEYSTNKKFKKAKRITVKSNKTVKKTVKKLKSKKQYYFRIRTYKKVGKKKYYSTWSKVKKVKIL